MLILIAVLAPYLVLNVLIIGHVYCFCYEWSLSDVKITFETFGDRRHSRVLLKQCVACRFNFTQQPSMYCMGRCFVVSMSEPNISFTVATVDQF